MIKKFLITTLLSIQLIANNAEIKASYNEGYQIDVNGGVNLFLSGSFIWWQARQEGMDLAITNPQGATLPVGQNIPNPNGEIIQMKFNYKPGFKVKAGYKTSYDDWEFSLGYTRLHFSQNQSSSAPNPPIGRLIPLWLNTTLKADAVNATWQCEIDLVDGQVARDCFVGKNLLFKPFFGLRLSLIDQKFNVTYRFANLRPISKNNSDSWALGPRAGLNAKWILGEGFRIFSNLTASLQYARFKLANVQNEAGNPANISVNAKDSVKALNPNTELALGLGWGSFFVDRQWHIDFEISYDFHVFWNQNRMAFFADQLFFPTSKGLSNLYLYGLTLSARLDF